VEPERIRREASKLIKSLRATTKSLETTKQLEAKKTELEKKIRDNDLSVKQRKTPENTKRQKRLIAQNKDLQRRIDLKRQIESLQDRLRTGDIFPTSKAAKTQSTEVDALEAERNDLQRVINQQIDAMKPRSPIVKFIQETVSLQRQLLTSLDMSAVGIQGALLGTRSPKVAASAIGRSIKAMFNKKVATREHNKIIMDKARFARSQMAGLWISEVDGGLQRGEEFFLSKVVKKIPLLKQATEGSERAFVTYLNILRYHTFNYLADNLTVGGRPTSEELKIIANYVNVSSGRGQGSVLDKNASLLSTVFFSPRYQASRFQYLFGQPILKGMMTDPNFKENFSKDKRARKLVASEMAKTVATLGLVYGLWGLGGGELEDDPRSSDFGKLKSGNTRIDTSGGIRSPLVMFSQVVGRGKKSPVTGKVRELRGQDLFNFLRFKMAPLPGASVDIMLGKDFKGDEIEPGSFVAENFIPISLSEVAEQMREQDFPESFITSSLSIFGLNVQTFEQNRKRRRR
jgi:hypothetical protein